MNPFAALLSEVRAKAGQPDGRRLRSLKVHEISVVAKPAVPGARISLAKSADPAAVTKAEVAAAVAMAKASTPAPRSFWKGHIDALGKALAPDASPVGQLNAVCRHPDGAALIRALATVGT